jgi:hypothetical protein
VAGSLRKRPDRGPEVWELRVFVGRDADRRVRHRSRIFRGTKRAAEKELSRMIFAVQDDKPEPVPDEASRPSSRRSAAGERSSIKSPRKSETLH